MSSLINKFKKAADAFTNEEIQAATTILESSGKKVVDAKDDAEGLVEGQCFICGRVGFDGEVETFMTHTSSYNLFVCNECREAFKN